MRLTVSDPDTPKAQFLVRRSSDAMSSQTIPASYDRFVADSSSILSLSLNVSSGFLLIPSLVIISSSEFYPTNWRPASSHTLTGDEESINILLPYIKYSSEFPGEAVMSMTLQSNQQSTQPRIIFSQATLKTIPSDSQMGITVITSDLESHVHILEDDVLLGLPVSVRPKVGTTDVTGDWEILIVPDRGTIIPGIQTGMLETASVLSSGPVLHLRASTLHILNDALNISTYKPPADFFGSVSFTVTATLNPTHALSYFVY